MEGCVSGRDSNSGRFSMRVDDLALWRAQLAPDSGGTAPPQASAVNRRKFYSVFPIDSSTVEMFLQSRTTMLVTPAFILVLCHACPRTSHREERVCGAIGSSFSLPVSRETTNQREDCVLKGRQKWVRSSTHLACTMCQSAKRNHFSFGRSTRSLVLRPRGREYDKKDS